MQYRISVGDECSGNKHTRKQLCRTGSFTRGMGVERGIYDPGEMGRVSGTMFVWLYTTGQGRNVGRCLMYILKGCRFRGRKPLLGQTIMKPDNCQSDEFVPGLALRHQDGMPKVANT